MKKVRILVLALLLALALVSSSFGAGSATIIRSDMWVLNQLQRRALSIVITAGTAGAYTDSTISASTYGITGWHLYSVEVIPGSPTPNSGFSVNVKDSDGIDICQSLLNFLSNAYPSLVNITGNNLFSYPVVRGDLTLSISDLGVTSSSIKLILVFVATKP